MIRARLAEAQTALMLLTRLPAGRLRAVPPMGSAVWAYPLAGVATGGVVAATLAMTGALPPLASALIAVAVGIVATGALHEDGLADLADSFGGQSRERRLEIMKDSRVGSFGVLALIVAVGLKVTLIADVDLALAAVGVAALSRGLLPVLMATQPQARAGGLGARAAEALRPATVVCGVAIGVALAAATLPLAVLLPVLAACAAGAAAVAWAARWQIGGITGDVLGAAQVVSEIAGWAVLAALT